MSVEYDEIQTRAYECPCGRGKYHVTVSGDQYGRLGYDWGMNCSECLNEYVAHDGRWVLKARLEEYQKAKAAADAVNDELVEILVRDYKEAWFGHWQLKTYKRTYDELQAAGNAPQPTLQTCRKNWDRYLMDALRQPQISVPLLEVSDNPVVAKLAEQLSALRERQHDRLVQMDERAVYIKLETPKFT